MQSSLFSIAQCQFLEISVQFFTITTGQHSPKLTFCIEELASECWPVLLFSSNDYVQTRQDIWKGFLLVSDRPISRICALVIGYLVRFKAT